MQFHSFFSMNYGYLGFIMNPKGDFSFACSAFDGRFGFSLLCKISISLSRESFYFLGGNDLFGIILYFYFLKTSFCILL